MGNKIKIFISGKICRNQYKNLICFATSLDPTEGTWLGLTDEVQEGEFRWLNGDVLRYNEWKVNEPNGRKQANCVVAFGNKMLDFSCSYSKHMMCSTIGRNKYFFPLQAQASEAWLKAGFSVFVARSVHKVVCRYVWFYVWNLHAILSTHLRCLKNSLQIFCWWSFYWNFIKL